MKQYTRTPYNHNFHHKNNQKFRKRTIEFNNARIDLLVNIKTAIEKKKPTKGQKSSGFNENQSHYFFTSYVTLARLSREKPASD